ncbi:MAG: hypothetical protein RBT35_00350 [Bacteroidales bacterium]|nr:hypothetical protein [Bacteroidales bacterium]
MIKLKIFNISYERGRQILLFLFCLFLAFIIWSIHKLSENYTVYMQYRVVAEAGIEGRSSEADSENLLIVRGKATGFYILQHRFTSNESRVRVSAERRYFRKREGVKDGFYILVKDINDKLIQSLGNTVFVESFATDTLFFIFPGQTNKKVPVKTNFSISFSPQYTFGSKPKITPDSVILYGESSLLTQIDSVVTKPVKHENLSLSLEGMTELVPINGVRFSQPDIRFSLDVVRYVEKSQLVPLVFLNLPQNVNLKAHPSEVMFYYSEKFGKEPVEEGSFILEIDFHEFETSVNGVVKVKLSGDHKEILSWRADPPFVEVKSEVADSLK